MSDRPEERPSPAAHGSDADEINALPAGFRFGELEILRTLGVGGFGIVYLAQDHALERLVAIKEYMPGQLAQRGDGSQVSVRSGSLRETFEIGRRSFVNEARLLARYDHPSLLKVYRFWEDHGTAYMVMPYLQGQTLRQARRAMRQAPGQDWILKQLLPVLDGLAMLHAEQVYHRDIAPDNILLPEDGDPPILLDFGAARRAISDRTQSFTAILKPSYAPIEQYAETAGLRQGAWTDVYALGAMLYELVQGVPPPPATARTVADDCPLLAELAPPGYTPAFLAAIDWALGVRPQDRPQSIAELRAALLGELQAPPPAPRHHAPAATPDPERTVVLPRTAAAEALAPTVLQQPSPPRRVPPPSSAPVPAPLPVARPAGKSWLPLAIVPALVLAAGAAWWLSGRKATEPAPALQQQPAVSAPAPLEVAPAPAAPVPAPEPATPVPAAPAPQAAPSAVVPAPLRPAPAAETPPRRERPAPATRTAPAPEPTAASSRPAEMVAPAAPRPVPAAAASRPAAPQEPADPRKACGSRVFIALARCIQRNCEQPQYAGHAECKAQTKYGERRDGAHE